MQVNRKSAESGCQSLSALFLLLNGRNERNRARQPTSWLTCKNGAETFNPRRFQGSEKTALNKCYFMRSFQAVLLIFFSCILPVSFLRGRLHFGIALEFFPRRQHIKFSPACPPKQSDEVFRKNNAPTNNNLPAHILSKSKLRYHFFLI